MVAGLVGYDCNIARIDRPLLYIAKSLQYNDLCD